MTRQRARTLLLLLVLSLLLAPWVHALIKPYRIRLDMTYYHEIPTPIYVYHSNHRKVATDFRGDQVEDLYVYAGVDSPPPLAFVRGIVRSTKPITGLRLDPATSPNHIAIGSISLHTIGGVLRLKARDLEPYVRAGNGITNVKLEGDVLSFDTLGDDPNFRLPLPPDMVSVSRSTENLIYLMSWAVAASMVLFTAVVIRKHHLGFTGRFRRPLMLLDGSTAQRAWSGLALDVGAGLVLIALVLQFVELYTHYDPSPLAQVLARDGVGKAVPGEVREMKKLVQRNGHHNFVLADGMGKGDDESEIFQRATEYLYPSRIVHQSEWVFGLTEGHLGPEYGHCEMVDKEKLIVLYACRP